MRPSDGYSVTDHGRMFTDQSRATAYCEALRRLVTPATSVVDVGTGTGFFALVAARLGARRVYAIECDDTIEVARELARQNDLSSRIDFIHADAMAVGLPERCDLLISDLRGSLPLYGQHLRTLARARRRFLAAGGRVLAQKDRLLVAVVEAAETYRRIVGPWHLKPEGLNLESVLAQAANCPTHERLGADAPVTQAAVWAEIDYQSVDHPSVRGEVSLTATRPAEAHGLLIWFEAIVFENIGFSSGPDSSVRIYAPLFLPWPSPVALATGDVVGVRLRADLVGEDYVWSWDSAMPGSFDFRQSSFLGSPLSADTLKALAPDHTPALDEEGEVARFVLNAIDGRTSLREIARRVVQRYPGKFAGEREARDGVAVLARAYGMSKLENSLFLAVRRD